ncbi:FYVE, RhoGEF and PH domain-containing protein 5 [Eulemur rufifrons]|uniref:FYVE, RhoGEF and PH domain-containing protein 5 n=1 Tax=Eulemur rufifrons TaxID=859984 RepID=UPI0037428919
MRRADSPKPPLAPKPKTASPLTPGTVPKFPSSPRPDSVPSLNSMFRGPKPPIAPKPRLAGAGEWRAGGGDTGETLGRYSNGRLPCGDGGLPGGHRAVPECSESETDEDYIVVPGSPRSAETVPPEGSLEEEEEHEEEGDACDMDGTGPGEDSEAPEAGGTPRGDAEEGVDRAPGNGEDGCHRDMGTEEQASPSQEEEEPAEEQDLGDRDGDGVFQSDVVLTQVDAGDPAVPGEEPGSPDSPGEEEDGEEGYGDATEAAGTEEDAGPDRTTEDAGRDTAEASAELPESDEVSPGVPDAEVAAGDTETSEELEATAAGGDQADGDDPPGRDDQTHQEEAAGDPQDAEDGYHIVPFESGCLDDLVTSLAGSPYALLPTESTSFCGDSCALSGPAKGSVSSSGRDPEVPEAGAGDGPAVPVPAVLTPQEEGGLDDALVDPYVLGVTTAGDPLEATHCDAEGGPVPSDRNSTVTRARPPAAKVAGHVPETVPEESGPDAGSAATGVPGDTEEARKPASPPDGKLLEAGRALPAKPRAFTLFPRSFSVESREVPVSLYREPEGSGSDEPRGKRHEDSLSLPCVIGSSGSFSQRNHLASSGTSTPSSVADIPPPFDLACVTKRPVTKSTPSLLLEGDSPDRHPKKKKSSFKRFLAMTFKRRTESKGHVDVHVSSSRSSSESSYHGPSRLLEIDRRSLSGSPQLKCRTGQLRACESPSSLILYRDSRRKGVPFGRTVSRGESFEDRSRPPFLPLPLTKPRSISFPNADTSDYENIPALSSDYENIHIPPRRPARTGTFTKVFEDQSRALAAANENDGYVDMSSFNAYDGKQQGADRDAESTYTEPYKVCPVLVAVPKEDVTSDEEQRSSEEEEEEEDSVPRDASVTPKVEGQSRALVIVQDLLSSEKAYVEMLQRLHLEFHGAVVRALDDGDQEGGDAVAREELKLSLSELPAILDLHLGILQELEERLAQWETQQKVADVFLAREQEFDHHAAHILQFDRCLALLGDNCLRCPQLAAAVCEFEQGLHGRGQTAKHHLLRVVQRLFQYQVLLTDYLNNLCPDSAEYDRTQGALSLLSKVTDRANDSMEQGENLRKLVHIEHSVRGQGDLLQPGREFLKEGTLMKVTGRNRRPRHLFLMNDVLLYTYPQKDGKYRLKSSLAVASMKVSRPVTEKVPYALRIETPESCLMLSASSCAERDDWYGCLGRALPEDCKAQALAAFQHSVEIRERLGVSLGERPPTLVPVTHVIMCMNCGCDFSLTLRRHHCQACGKIVCRNCSRNKYPLKYLKDRLAKVCDGCFAELQKRGGNVPGPMRERPVSMSFPLSTPRFSSVFHSISPATFKKQKKVPSALTEVAASGEGSAISGYLSRCKKGRRHWKKLWFVIKGKVLYTYVAREDRVALETLPLLGFTIAPEKEKGGSEVGPTFHLYHKKSLFYSFKAEDAKSAQRWMEAMEDASVL